MKYFGFLILLASCSVLAAATYFGAEAAEEDFSRTVRREAAQIAKIEAASPEETCRQRNQELNQLFEQYIQRQGGEVTGRSIRRFNHLVTQSGMSCFDDFREAMLTPLRYVRDPAHGDKVPVLGPLGSDIINPWLAAMGVAEGKPLEEQPMYQLAAEVLREHIDFAIIGTQDPNLSLQLLPPELQENARWAYKRLNPTNQFNGGFDHPLFYITIREAAKKLFREDHPAAKLTMADLVLPEHQEGFGIRSCLLCHNRSHAGVYSRLIGQSYYFQAKAEQSRSELDAVGENALATGESSEVKEAEETAAMFQLAAHRVLRSNRDKIDPEAVRSALGEVSAENISQLKPGYDEFYETLDMIGCTMCHSSTADPPAETNPAKFNAFVLNPNNYFKTKNVVALASLVDLEDPGQSKLLAKAEGTVKHRGEDELPLDEVDREILREALHEWLDFRVGED